MGWQDEVIRAARSLLRVLVQNSIMSYRSNGDKTIESQLSHAPRPSNFLQKFRASAPSMDRQRLLLSKGPKSLQGFCFCRGCRKGPESASLIFTKTKCISADRLSQHQLMKVVKQPRLSAELLSTQYPSYSLFPSQRTDVGGTKFFLTSSHSSSIRTQESRGHPIEG